MAISVAVLPGVRPPTAFGFKPDEIRRMLTMGDTPRESWLFKYASRPPIALRGRG